MIQETSLEAYNNLEKVTKETMQLRVYDVIKRYPGICDKQIAEVLKVEINRITPRRGEITKKGWVVMGWKKKHNGRLVNTWIDKELVR